jgi:hypothetical protein
MKDLALAQISLLLSTRTTRGPWKYMVDELAPEISSWRTPGKYFRDSELCVSGGVQVRRQRQFIGLSRRITILVCRTQIPTLTSSTFS